METLVKDICQAITENRLNLPPLPETYDWFRRVSRFGPMGNLDAGDCVVAGAGHMVQTWTANQGKDELGLISLGSPAAPGRTEAMRKDANGTE